MFTAEIALTQAEFLPLEAFDTGGNGNGENPDRPQRTAVSGCGAATSLVRFVDQAGLSRSKEMLNTSIQWFIFVEPEWSLLGQPPSPRALAPERSKKLTLLLQEWLADESGYDEQVWPEVKAGIEQNRLSSRSRFGA